MAQKKLITLEKLTLYHEELKKLINAGDAKSLADAKAYLESIRDEFDVSGAAATVQELLDKEIERAKAKEDEIVASVTAAEKKTDDLKTYVGTLPEGATATDVISYVQEKTSGIATDAALGELQTAVNVANEKITAIEDDYLKDEDKTALETKITAEAELARAAEKKNADAIEAISKDYLKTADKTELQAKIDADKAILDAVKEDVDAFFADADLTENAKDTLKELQEYIKSDETAASAMTASIQQNTNDIDAVEERATALEGKMTDVETKASDNATEIEALKASIGEGGSVDEKIAAAVKTETDARTEAVAGVKAVADQGVADAASALKAAQDADSKADELNTAMDVRVKVVEGKAHEHDNNALLDTYAQTEADLADAVAKKHEHENATVLDGISATKVATWDKVTDKADATALQTEVDRATAAETALGARIDEFVEVSELEIKGIFA